MRWEKNCCAIVVRSRSVTRAALWRESMTEPVTWSMEIQTLPSFLPVANRLLKQNDGIREYQRSPASSRSPEGNESQSPVSQPNFLCPPSLAHSARFCPAWGNQATMWTDARLKSRYPWESAIRHQFAFQLCGWGHTGHICTNCKSVAGPSPLSRISRILYMIRDSVLSFLDWCHQEMSKVYLLLWHERLWFVYWWNQTLVFQWVSMGRCCQSCHFLPGDQCLRFCLRGDTSHDLTFRQKRLAARDRLQPVFAVPWEIRRFSLHAHKPTANMQQGTS